MLLKKLTSALLLLAILPIYVTAQSNAADSIDLFLVRTMKEKKIPALQLAIVREGKS
jgi:hypothetical protein